MNLRTPVCDLFDIDVPIFLAGMGGVAYAEVCAAVSEAGGYGSLGMRMTGARSPALGAGGNDPAGDPLRAGEHRPRRRRFELDDRGFDEVPKKYRKYYRLWGGQDDVLAPNEALCPVCKIVIRSVRELRPGDRLYCMACMTRMTVVAGDGGCLEAQVIY